MPLRNETDRDAIEDAQDAISFRRITAYELRSLADQVDALKQHRMRPIPWWMPAIFGVVLSGAIGYIGIVHTMGLTNQTRINEVRDEQQRRSSLNGDVEELKRRLLANESITQQMPFLVRQVESMSVKLDRLLERQPPR